MDRWIAPIVALALSTGHAAADGFLLELTGSPGLRFGGTCLLVPLGAPERRVEIEGLAPHRFEIEAEALSCTIQKMDERGRLRATLSTRAGGALAAETNALFGAVSVRSDGPWGRSRASENAPRFRLGTGPDRPSAPRERVPMVPPLKGTTVPPLK